MGEIETFPRYNHIVVPGQEDKSTPTSFLVLHPSTRSVYQPLGASEECRQDYVGEVSAKSTEGGRSTGGYVSRDYVEIQRPQRNLGQKMITPASQLDQYGARIMQTLYKLLIRLNKYEIAQRFPPMLKATGQLVHLGIAATAELANTEAMQKLHDLFEVVLAVEAIEKSIENQLIRKARDEINLYCANVHLMALIALLDEWTGSCEEHLRKRHGPTSPRVLSIVNIYKEITSIDAVPNGSGWGPSDCLLALFKELGLTAQYVPEDDERSD